MAHHEGRVRRHGDCHGGRPARTGSLRGVQGHDEDRETHQVDEHPHGLGRVVGLAAPLDQLEDPQREPADRHVVEESAQQDPQRGEPQHLHHEGEPDGQRHGVPQAGRLAEVAEEGEEAGPREPCVEHREGLATPHDRLSEPCVHVGHREAGLPLDRERRPVDEQDEDAEVEGPQPWQGPRSRQVGDEGDTQHRQGDEVVAVQRLDQPVLTDVLRGARPQAQHAQRQPEPEADAEPDDADAAETAAPSRCPSRSRDAPHARPARSPAACPARVGHGTRTGARRLDRGRRAPSGRASPSRCRSSVLTPRHDPEETVRVRV